MAWFDVVIGTSRFSSDVLTLSCLYRTQGHIALNSDLNANLGSHWKFTYRKTPPYAWMSLLKLQDFDFDGTTASKYGYIGQRMDIPIPCTFSITGCTKLIMVANSILSGAL